jgi:hypothetical protein
VFDIKSEKFYRQELTCTIECFQVSFFMSNAALCLIPAPNTHIGEGLQPSLRSALPTACLVA